MTKAVSRSVVCLGLLAAVLLPLLLPAPVAAQAHLDPGTFIDGLGKRNMSDLLQHLVETEPPQDPVVAAQIEIASLVMRANDLVLPVEQRKAAVNDIVTATRKLIKDHFDHDQRPVWQTDMAERYFEGKLQYANELAAYFYEFGVCTHAQKQAVENEVADIFVQLSQADIRFRQLEDALARDTERRNVLEFSGQLDRMFNEYWRTKTQVYLARAAYFTALLPDSHPYYQNLGNGVVPLQRNNPSEERKRLFELAVRTIEPLANGQNDRVGLSNQLLCQSLLGRAQSQAGRHAEAIETLTKVTKANKSDETDFIAGLGRAMAMHRNGQAGSCEEQLLMLDKHVWAQAAPFRRLLVKDALHRVLIDRAVAAPAAQRELLTAEAYEPYFALLADMRREADVEIVKLAAGLENYIYKRWQENVDPRVGLDKLPAAVVMGIGTAARGEGELLANEADKARKADNQARAAELQKQADVKLRHAIEVLTPLLQREGLLDPVRARAMYNLALATYFTAPQNIATAMESARQWTALADLLPEQPESEKAIGNAVNVLGRIFAAAPGVDGVRRDYERAMEVLFTKFPATKFADDFRASYVYEVLMPQRRFDEAVHIAEGVPFLHPTYFMARREMLYAMLEQYKASPDENREQSRQRVRAAAERLLEEAEPLNAGKPVAEVERALASLNDPMADADLQRQGAAFSAAGHARLILSQMAEDEAKIDEAMKQLEDFEVTYKADPSLAREGISRRVSVLISARKPQEAAREAERMMEMFSDEAVATVESAVASLKRQIQDIELQLTKPLGEQLRRTLTDRLGMLSEAMVMFTRISYDWALKQNLPPEEMLAFRLARVEALCLTRQGDEAVRVAEPLKRQFPNDPRVIHYMGEALFVRGTEKNNKDDLLKSVVENYDILIEGLDPASRPGQPISEQFWNAWMRRMQVMEKLNQYTTDIPIRVRALRLVDPSLGGEPYSSEFARLEAKFRNQ